MILVIDDFLGLLNRYTMLADVLDVAFRIFFQVPDTFDGPFAKRTRANHGLGSYQCIRERLSINEALFDLG